MAKPNKVCKKCGDHYIICKCEMENYLGWGYCSKECYVKAPLLERLELEGQYEALEEIDRLTTLVNELMEDEVSQR